MSDPLRTFLELPYDELEELNLAAKAQRLARVPADQVAEERLRSALRPPSGCCFRLPAAP